MVSMRKSSRLTMELFFHRVKEKGQAQEVSRITIRIEEDKERKTQIYMI
jgi:hypothetical protein